MSNEALANELFRLLGHRTNAYYIYDNDTGVPKLAKGKTKFRNYADLPLTVNVIQKHLDGEITIGIFPHNLEDECIFFAIDIDYHEKSDDDKSKKKTNYRDAKRIRDYLWNEHKRIALVEQSGSEKSYHVWTFFKPTPGDKVRAFVFGMLKEIGISKDDVEIFPKQDKASAAEKGYGNQIKFPCGIHRESNERSHFLTPKLFSEPLVNFVNFKSQEKFAQYINTINETKIELPTTFDHTIKSNESEIKEEKKKEPNILFEEILSRQPLCLKVPYLFKGMKIPKAMKFIGTYNNILFGGTDNQALLWFVNQKDYDEEISEAKIAEVRKIINDKIWEKRSINPKREFDPTKIEKIQREIDNDVRQGKYYYMAIRDCKKLSVKGGKKMRKELCEGICQARKNFQSSTDNFDSIKAERGTKIPIIQIIWKEINKPENFYEKYEKKKKKKIEYIQVLTTELEKVLKKYPKLGISDVESLIRFYFVPLGLMKTRGDGQLTHSTSSGSKYRFIKKNIEDVLKSE